MPRAYDQPPLEPYECASSELLTEQELIALGTVAAEWGLLEMALEWHGRRVLSLRIGLAYLTGGAGGRRYAEILRHAVAVVFREKPDVVANAIAHLNVVDSLGVERNDLLHAAWTHVLEVASTELPSQTWAERPGAWGYIFKKRGSEWKALEYSAEQMMDVARRISRVRLAVNRTMLELYGDVPIVT